MIIEKIYLESTFMIECDQVRCTDDGESIKYSIGRSDYSITLRTDSELVAVRIHYGTFVKEFIKPVQALELVNPTIETIKIHMREEAEKADRLYLEARQKDLSELMDLYTSGWESFANLKSKVKEGFYTKEELNVILRGFDYDFVENCIKIRNWDLNTLEGWR